MRYAVLTLTLALLALGQGKAGMTQTPDGENPSEEEACDKYKGEGARYGLCIAYCEAQDCTGVFKDEVSCENIAQNFIDWSVRKGYVPKPSPKETISCKETACTPEDVSLCGGKERDCEVDGECTATCTRTFEGFSSEGKPLCAADRCSICVGEDPKIHF